MREQTVIADRDCQSSTIASTKAANGMITDPRLTYRSVLDIAAARSPLVTSAA
jgi:hypothetical protein